MSQVVSMNSSDVRVNRCGLSPFSVYSRLQLKPRSAPANLRAFAPDPVVPSAAPERSAARSLVSQSSRASKSTAAPRSGSPPPPEEWPLDS